MMRHGARAAGRAPRAPSSRRGPRLPEFALGRAVARITSAAACCVGSVFGCWSIMVLGRRFLLIRQPGDGRSMGERESRAEPPYAFCRAVFEPNSTLGADCFGSPARGMQAVVQVFALRDHVRHLPGEIQAELSQRRWTTNARS